MLCLQVVVIIGIINVRRLLIQVARVTRLPYLLYERLCEKTFRSKSIESEIDLLKYQDQQSL